MDFPTNGKSVGGATSALFHRRVSPLFAVGQSRSYCNALVRSRSMPVRRNRPSRISRRVVSLPLERTKAGFSKSHYRPVVAGLPVRVLDLLFPSVLTVESSSIGGRHMGWSKGRRPPLYPASSGVGRRRIHPTGPPRSLIFRLSIVLSNPLRPNHAHFWCSCRPGVLHLYLRPCSTSRTPLFYSAKRWPLTDVVLCMSRGLIPQLIRRAIAVCGRYASRPILMRIHPVRFRYRSSMQSLRAHPLMSDIEFLGARTSPRAFQCAHHTR